MKMKPKGGMTGGKQPKATEMGTESNKQYVKRMFGIGMSTKMTNDMPMENKGYFAGKKVEMGKRPMTTKGGMSGGRNSKRMIKTKGGMRGGYKRGLKTKSYAKGGKS